MAIEVRELIRRFRSFQLGPLDMNVDQGSVVALVGNNASGKSTLFRLLTGLLTFDQGSIHFYSQRKQLSEQEAKRKIGYVGRPFGLFQHETIDSLASFFSYWYPNWDQQKYQRLIQRYQIDPQTSLAKCSNGTQKKVELILALSSSPQWLLLDEPSLGLDLSSQKLLYEDLLDFMEEERNSILIASHNPEEISRIADRIYLIHEGKIIDIFSKDEVYEKWSYVWIEQPLPIQLTNHPAVIEHETNHFVTNDLPEIEKLLHEEGIAVAHLQRFTLREVMETILERSNQKSE